MSFREPAILWFALLLIVPLILYLLPMPRRLVVASALYLWQRFLSAQRFGHTSERFRRALGFALLAAALLSLILAAADLTVGKTSITTRNIVVLIDASASMSATIDGKSNLSRAKEAARQLIESLDGGSQVAVVAATSELHVLQSLDALGQSAANKLRQIQPFDGPCDLRRALAELWNLWGDRRDAEIIVFTDNQLPPSDWGARARAWIAPAVGDGGNAGIIAISAQRRRGGEIAITFALANYAPAPRTLSGTIVVNGEARGQFENVTLGTGQTVRRSVRIDEPDAAEVQVTLTGNKDALAADDRASVHVPSLDQMRIGVLWPQGTRRNDYVAAVLSALQDEGSAGPVVENSSTSAPVTVYVNQLPSTWPDGGAIVLYPLRSGVIEVTGLHSTPLTVARQAEHELLTGVDLRGLPVKGAVEAPVPTWATPLAWAENNLPLLWAGQTGNTKVLFVGIPLMPSGSRLPLVASFPALMRNAVQWMLPRIQPKGVSADESDLRRPPNLKGETLARRHSTATVFIIIALVLLPLEWGLFHKRVTE